MQPLTEQQLLDLLNKYHSNSLSETEVIVLEQWIALQEERPEYFKNEEEAVFEQWSAGTWKQIQQKLPQSASAKIVSLSSRRKKWYWSAAILILAICSGVYYLNHESDQSPKTQPITHQTKDLQEIPPGTHRAILTFANGTQKELSLADNGLQLQSDAVRLTTPNGGQYQAILPDGSKVWLNTASSIRFPSKFNKERRVEVTGEVYFEVVKDASRPFKVTGGGQEIEVLGTSFNINIYNDEPTKKTTLITGSIKITSNNQTAILHPGQQANISSLSNLPIRLIPVQTNEVLAWKSGLFNFNNTPLNEAMRQFARWYDVEIEYAPEVSTTEIIKGEMQRNLTLTQALKILENIGFQYERNGRVITIKPS